MCHFLPVYYLGIVFLGWVEGQNITVVISHLLKVMSTSASERRRLLLTGGQSYRNLISLIKYNGISFNCIVAPLRLRGKARWELHKDATYCFKQILDVAPNKTATVRPLTSHLRNNPSKMSKIYWAFLGKERKKSLDTFSYRLHYTEISVLADHERY